MGEKRYYFVERTERVNRLNILTNFHSYCKADIPKKGSQGHT